MKWGVWRVAVCPSYIQEARFLKVNVKSSRCVCLIHTNTKYQSKHNNLLYNYCLWDTSSEQQSLQTQDNTSQQYYCNVTDSFLYIEAKIITTIPSAAKSDLHTVHIYPALSTLLLHIHPAITPPTLNSRALPNKIKPNLYTYIHIT